LDFTFPKNLNETNKLILAFTLWVQDSLNPFIWYYYIFCCEFSQRGYMASCVIEKMVSYPIFDFSKVSIGALIYRIYILYMTLSFDHF
jgi:hypothetical protein